MDRKRVIIVLAWTCTLVWMGIIFYLSSQPAVESARLSAGVKDELFNFLSLFIPGIEHLEIAGIDYYIRKNAHFFAYLILGGLAYFALIQSQIRKPFLVAMVICVSYAMSDEFHQFFVAGRSAQISDVLLDSSGAFLGVCMMFFAVRIAARRLNSWL